MLESLRPLIGFLLRSPAILFLGIWGLLALAPLRSRLGVWRRPRPWLLVGGSAAILLVARITCYVVALPGYGHPGVQMVSASALLARGEPLYHPLDAPARYSLLYGPVSYLLNDAVLALLPGGERTIVWVHIGLFGAATLLLARVLRREGPDWCARCGLAAFLAVVLAFGTMAYSVLSDTLLLLAGVIGLALARGTGRTGWRAIGLGLAAGLATGGKVHGGLYLAPAAVLLAAGAGAWTLAVVLASAVAASLLPFLHPGIGLAAYLDLLRAASRHGLSAYESITTIATAAFFLLPCLALRLPPGKRPRGWAAFVATLAASMAVVSVLAGKPGAGPHHLLPFLPLVVWSWMRSAPVALAAERGSGAMAWLAAGAIFVVAKFGLELRDLDLARSRAVAAEVDAFLERLAPEPIQLGLGASLPGVALHAPAPRLVLAGHPYWFDPAALFDLAAAGNAPPPSSARLVASCGTRWWLIPRGEQPFALPSIYDPGRTLFDDRFREAFLRHHEHVASGTWYDLWRCREEVSGSRADQPRSEPRNSTVPSTPTRR